MVVNGTSLWSIKKFIPVCRTRNCNCACFTCYSAKKANIFQNLTFLKKNKEKNKEILVTRTYLVAKKLVQWSMNYLFLEKVKNARNDRNRRIMPKLLLSQSIKARVISTTQCKEQI